MGTDAAGIVGHLAHPDRRRVLAALILGASTTDDVKQMTGLGTRAVVTALTRLVDSDLLLHDEDGRYWLVEESFRQAVIDAQSTPQPAEHTGVAADAARVLRAFVGAGPLGSERPNVPCSHMPQPSAPAQVARATWSMTPNGVRATMSGSLRS